MSRTKPAAHVYRADPDLPPDSRGRHLCRCGLREDNERHQLPAVPEQAEHRHRYGDDE